MDGAVEGVGFVVGVATLVSIDDHEAISLSIGDFGSIWAVDGDLVVVATESVSVGIGVREESSLEHLVLGRLNTGDQMRGRESGLLNISEIVFGVSVEDHLSDVDQGIVLVGPDLGDIENVPLVVLSIFGRHNLNLDTPGGRFARGNVVEEVSGGIVTISGLDLVSLLGRQILDSGISLEVVFNEELLTLLIDPLESVGAVTIHVSVTIGGTSVREEDGDLMGRFRGKGKEVPEHVGILQVGLGISLLGVDEIGEFQGVSDEEDWGVVSDHIPVTFFSVELDGKTSGVSFGISRSLFTTDSGESGEDGGSLSDLAEDFGFAVLGNVIGNLKITVSASTLGMDDSFGNSFSVEMSKLVDKMEVLQKDRTIFTGGKRVLVVIDGRTS